MLSSAHTRRRSWKRLFCLFSDLYVISVCLAFVLEVCDMLVWSPSMSMMCSYHRLVMLMKRLQKMQSKWFALVSPRAENIAGFLGAFLWSTAYAIHFMSRCSCPRRSHLLLTWNRSCPLHGMSLPVIRGELLKGFIIAEVPNSAECCLVPLMNVIICVLVGASPTTAEV